MYAQEQLSKKVLVLHSYHRGLSWDDSIDRGIESVFKKTGKDVITQIEYMDTKRIHDSKYLQQLFEIYQHKFRNQRFDVIISVDNNAFNFLRQHRDELFSGTATVFCGVNNFQDSMLKNQKLFTGVVEAVDIKETLDIALELHPKNKKIYKLYLQTA